MRYKLNNKLFKVGSRFKRFNAIFLISLGFYTSTKFHVPTLICVTSIVLVCRRQQELQQRWEVKPMKTG